MFGLHNRMFKQVHTALAEEVSSSGNPDVKRKVLMPAFMNACEGKFR